MKANDGGGFSLGEEEGLPVLLTMDDSVTKVPGLGILVWLDRRNKTFLQLSDG